MQLNWNQLVDLRQGAAAPALDVFFQPAVTWTSGNVKAVALCFVENDPQKADGTGDDFKTLTLGLLQWTLSVAGVSQTDPLNLAFFDQLFNDVLAQPFTYPQLNAFWRLNYVFRLREPSGELKGTIFPMFPEIVLETGAGREQNSVNVSPRTLSQAFGGALTNRFAPEQPGTNPEQEDTTVRSVRALMCADYARLIVRTMLQLVRDQLRPTPDRTLTRGALLALWNQRERAALEAGRRSPVQMIAGLVSRLMLHGLCLPVDGAGVDASQPVYEATGQQFSLVDAFIADTNTYRFTISGPASAAFLQFVPAVGQTVPDPADGPLRRLEYRLERSENAAGGKYALVGLVRSLEALTDPPPPPLAFDPSQVQLRNFYEEEARLFALREFIEWEDAQTTPRLVFQLPLSLQFFLATREQNPTIGLYRSPLGSRTTDLTAPAFFVPDADYFWVSRIDIPIQRVPKSDGDGFVRDTFELSGLSETDTNLLESALTQQSDAITGLSLLRMAGDAGTLVALPGSSDNTRLIRTRLATNNPDDDPSAPAFDPDDVTSFPAATANMGVPASFLQLLWEGASVDGGGYYFYLPGATELFTDETPTISLLIEYDIAGDPIFDFHNSVVLQSGGETPVAESLIVAKVEDETVPVLAVPAGFVGLQFVCPQSGSQLPSATLQRATSLRVEPSEDAAQLAALGQGQPVMVVNRSENNQYVFVLVPTNGTVNRGWIRLREADPDAATIVDIPDDLNLRRAIREVDNIFQLLGFDIVGSAGHDRMPIGPTRLPPDRWLYERLLPAFSLVPENTPTGDETDLRSPPESRNPYRGIVTSSGDSADIGIRFGWQDVYGNRLTAQSPPRAFGLHYTDPLIGLNQWPSVDETYRIFRDPTGELRLDLELAFTTAPYRGLEPGNAVERRLTSDISALEKIFFQIRQPDVRVTVATSLSDWSADFRATDAHGGSSLLGFISQAYRYLTSLREDAAAVSQPPEALTIRLDASELVPAQAFVTALDATLTIRRDPKYIHPQIREQGERLAEVQATTAILSPRHDAITYTIPAGETAVAISLTEAVADINLLLPPQSQLSAAELVRRQRDLPATVAPGQTLGLSNLALPTLDPQARTRLESATVTTVEGDSFATLTARILDALRSVLGQGLESIDAEEPLEFVNFTLEDLIENVKETRGFLRVGTNFVIDAMNLRSFAESFAQAFPGFHLAVSEEGSSSGTGDRPPGPGSFLFAVYLGAGGLTYDIAEQDPDFFAIPPLATTLVSGRASVLEYPLPDDPDTSAGNSIAVEGIDINVLARDFLVAVENFLEPETLVPALALEREMVEAILRSKYTLAERISRQVVPILQADQKPRPERLQEARDAFRQRLRAHLVEGFDIETAVQFAVEIRDAQGLLRAPQPEQLPPRLTGRARVLNLVRDADDNVLEDLDYVLSAGRIRLRGSELPDSAAADAPTSISSFTYLFDTKTPEQLANIRLELELEPLEVEVEVTRLALNSAFVATTPLRFIAPEKLNQYRLSAGVMAALEAQFGDDERLAGALDALAAVESELQRSSLAAFETAIQSVIGTDAYTQIRSVLLSFANPNYMGTSPVPIPLRHYPIPPSLIYQRADADSDSLGDIRELRTWQYTAVYEHPDIAQDSINCLLSLNTFDPPLSAEDGATQAPGSVLVFHSRLINFSQILPSLQQALAPLAGGEPTDDERAAAVQAIAALRFFSQEIAREWSTAAVDGDAFDTGEDPLYEIRERVSVRDDSGEPEQIEAQLSIKRGFGVQGDFEPPAARLEIPGFRQIATDPDGPAGQTDGATVTFTFERSDEGAPNFGDSSLPDRNLIVDNLDILETQNAWATVQLRRNQVLVPGQATNPAFVFRTPSVRFANRLTPFLTNDEPFDIADLRDSDVPIPLPLADHLRNLVALLQPRVPDPGPDGLRYAARLSCRYAFSLVRGTGLNEDLITTLPVLLGLRIDPRQRLGETDLLDAYPERLADELKIWLNTQQPVRENAFFLFTFDIFSGLDPSENTDLPLLRVRRLALNLADVSDL